MIDIGESVGVWIIHQLSNRGGFDGWWDDIDDDIQNEIVIEINHTVAEWLSSVLKDSPTPDEEREAG